MKTMKHRMISMVAGLLLAGLLPLAAQTLPWRSTSALKGAGSEYSAKTVYAEAEKVAFIPMKSTSAMMETGYVPTPDIDTTEPTTTRGPRRAFDVGGESGQSEEFPIGEPWVLLAFAAASAGVIAWRRRVALAQTSKE